MYLVTASEMREMDKLTIDFGIPGIVLMENAGRGAVQVLFEKYSNLNRKKIGIIAGSGNNGGDGYVIARYLVGKGINTEVFILADKNKIKGDAKLNYDLIKDLNTPVFYIPDPVSFHKQRTNMMHKNLWVDAILGTGLKSEVKGYYGEVIEFINLCGKPVLSVDIPSGLNSETGQKYGACIKADTTVTFAFPKIGHVSHPGKSYTGNLKVVDIGIPQKIVDKVNPKQTLITESLIKSYFKKRKPDAHKGNTGHLLIVAGSAGKFGAASMTATAAMRTGAGLVSVAGPSGLNPVLEAQALESMIISLPETENGMIDEPAAQVVLKLVKDKKCLAIGPGLGTSNATQKAVCEIIKKCSQPIVIDADGINNIAGNLDILSEKETPVVLTPHPGEMAGLIGVSAAEIQKNRIKYSRDFSVKYRVHLILKGAATVAAHPDGTVFVNQTGNSAMASGGMGDVLTGIISGLVTQGYSLKASAHMAVFLHGRAADELVQTRGPVGILASDIIFSIPAQIKKISAGRKTEPSLIEEPVEDLVLSL